MTNESFSVEFSGKVGATSSASEIKIAVLPSGRNIDGKDEGEKPLENFFVSCHT